MKVCPVCEMEEEDNAATCSMCGSDFEDTNKEETTKQNVEDIPSSQNEVPNEENTTGGTGTEETTSEKEEIELTEEEKELEKTLSAIESNESKGSDEKDTSAEKKNESEDGFFNQILTQFSQIKNQFGGINKRLDKIFLTKGELNYIAPLTIVVLSILLLSGVVGLLGATVPGTDEESTDGWTTTKPITDTVYDENNTAKSINKGRPVGEPFTGEPFHCEWFDALRYYDFMETNSAGVDIKITDRNANGELEDDERYGCPVDMKSISTISFFILNLLLLTTGFYIYNKVSNTAIVIPVLAFGSIETILFVLYGGILNNLIFALPLTIGFVCTIGLIVSGSVLLVRTSLARPLDDPPTATFYIFIIAAALLFSTAFYNYSLGPYAVCEDEMTPNERFYTVTNVTEENQALITECQMLGYNYLSVKPLDLGNGDNMILLLSATFIFLGVTNWLISNTKINDIDEAKYFSMILSGLVLQFAILVFNVVTSEEGGLGFDENDTTLTIMALGVATVGMVQFYRKRRGEAGSMGIAYFVIFVSGIFALFGTFIAPVVLGGNDVKWPEDGDEQFNLLLSALVTAVGFWLSYKFGSQKLRELSIASDAAMPNRQDPFAPSIPGEQKAMPEWSVDSAMEFLMNEYGEEFQIELKHTTEHTPDLELVEKTMMDKVDQSVEIRPAIEVDYEVDFHEIAEAYSTTKETVDEVITHLTSGKNIMLFGEPGTGKTALSNILLTKLCA